MQARPLMLVKLPEGQAALPEPARDPEDDEEREF
jgi:hypothetical protein